MGVNKQALVVLHYHSMSRALFARFSLPDTLVSDNGAGFTGKDFEESLKLNGIRHVTSALITHRPMGWLKELSRLPIMTRNAANPVQPSSSFSEPAGFLSEQSLNTVLPKHIKVTARTITPS